MELLGDVGYVESLFLLFGDCVSVSVRPVHGLHYTYHRLRKSFWTYLVVPQGDEAQVEVHFSPFRDSANLDRR
jgi:hypothetical protein